MQHYDSPIYIILKPFKIQTNLPIVMSPSISHSEQTTAPGAILILKTNGN